MVASIKKSFINMQSINYSSFVILCIEFCVCFDHRRYPEVPSTGIIVNDAVMKVLCERHKIREGVDLP